MLQSQPDNLIGWRTESGDAGLLSLQVRGLLGLGPRHQVKWRNVSSGGDDDDVAACARGCERGGRARLYNRRASPQHGRDHPGATADADELDVESLGGKVPSLLGDPGGRPTCGETRVQKAHGSRGAETVRKWPGDKQNDQCD